jgi:transposase
VALATRGLDPGGLIAVPIGVGRRQAAALVCDFAGELLARPFRLAMNRARVAVGTVGGRSGWSGRDRGGGHFHQPLLGEGVLPAGWQVVQVNPAWSRATRRRGAAWGQDDALDLVAISDLLRAGQGAQYAHPAVIMVELASSANSNPMCLPAMAGRRVKRRQSYAQGGAVELRP